MGKKSKKKKNANTRRKQNEGLPQTEMVPEKDLIVIAENSQNTHENRSPSSKDGEERTNNKKSQNGETLENPNEEIITGQDLLDCARYGEIDNVRAVIEKYHVPVNYQDEQHNTALLYASANGHLDVVEYLVSRGAEFLANKSGNSPLHWAAQNSQAEVVKFLTQHFQGIDVLQKNSFGKSALTDAFASGKTESINEILEHPSANEEALLGGTGGGPNNQDECKDSDKQAQDAENSSIIHKFDFLRSVEDPDSEETDQTGNKKLVMIRELAIQNADSPFGDTPDQDTTGYGLWSASLVLGRWVASQPDRFKGKVVCELGAGCGVGGLAAAVHSSPAKVYITDLNPVTLGNIDYNISINVSGIEEGCANSLALDWGDPSTWPEEKVDVVIGSDLIYQKSTVPILQTVLAGMLSENGEFLYVCPESGRDGLEDFIGTMNSVGFHLVSSELAPSIFKSNPLFESSDDECFLHFVDLQTSTYMLHEFHRL